MRIRSLENPLYSLVIITILWMLMHFLFWLSVSDSSWIATPYFAQFKILITFGITLIGASAGSNKMSGMLPVNFYKTDNKNYLFYHFSFGIILKFFFLAVGISMMVMGYSYEPVIENSSGEDSTGFLSLYEWLITIIGFLFLIRITVGIIAEFKTLIHNKDDYLEINAFSFKWNDNDQGEIEVNDTVNKIVLIREKDHETDEPNEEINKIELHLKENEIKIINLEMMSLEAFGDKILKVIQSLYPNTEIIDPKKNLTKN